MEMGNTKEIASYLLNSEISPIKENRNEGDGVNEDDEILTRLATTFSNRICLF